MLRMGKIRFRLELIQTDKRGFGIRTKEAIPGSAVIMEYIGVLTDNETKGDYVLLFDEGFVINADSAGNLARFVNHSCKPNCKVMKRVVKGKPRMALHAMGPISPDTELTFDYHFTSNGESKACLCGEPVCRGTLEKPPRDKRQQEGRKRQGTKQKRLDPNIEVPGTTVTKAPKKRKQFESLARKPYNDKAADRPTCKKMAICSSCKQHDPLRRRRGVISWVFCSGCGWNHVTCVGMSRDDCRKLPDQWYCQKCSQQVSPVAHAGTETLQGGNQGSPQYQATLPPPAAAPAARDVDGHPSHADGNSLTLMNLTMEFEMRTSEGIRLWRPKERFELMTLGTLLEGLKEQLKQLKVEASLNTFECHVESADADSSFQKVTFAIRSNGAADFDHYRDRTLRKMHHQTQTGITARPLVFKVKIEKHNSPNLEAGAGVTTQDGSLFVQRAGHELPKRA
ncbi:SET domain protein, partial [Fusarium vanettenii 77-13-4]